MLSEKLVPIGKKFSIEQQSVIAIDKFLSGLRKQDVITATLMSRKALISLSKAEEILPELVNEGILTYFIVVACENPDIDDAQAEHYQTFHSLKEFAQFSSITPCPVCDCGFPFGNNARVGFKIAK